MRTCIFAVLLISAILTAPAAYAQSGPLRATPTRIDFGPVQVGESVTRPVTVFLTGDFEIEELDADLSVDNGAFTLSRSSIRVTTTRRTFDVTFTPAAEGEVTGTLSVEAGYEDTVRLSGTGVTGFMVDPAELELGDTPVGCAVDGMFTVDAPRAYDFTVLTSDPQFMATPPTFTGMGTFPVTITARPTTVGPLTGRSDVTGTAAGAAAMTVPVPLSVRGADVIPAPTALDFGTVAAGTESTPMGIGLALDSGAPTGLMVAATSDNPAFVVQPVTGTDRVNVVFAPPTDGPQTGMITVVLTSATDTLCRIERMVPVSGTGAPGDVTIAPGALDFGTLLVGQTSGVMSVTLTSQATAAFDATVELDNPNFQVTPVAFSLPAGGTQNLDFTFAPMDPAAQTGTATISLATAAGSTLSLTVALSGTAASFTVEPPVYDFGAVGLGVGAMASFTVTNALASPLSVDIVSGAPFIAAVANVTVPASGSTPVDVTFTPEVVGVAQGEISFTARPAEGVTEVRSATVSGEGVEVVLRYEITVGEATGPLVGGQLINFERVALGSTSTVNVNIFNDGAAEYALDGLSASGPGFGLMLTPGVPPVVPAGGQYGVPLEFSPAGLGIASGSLAINGAAFPLAGRGVLDAATLSGIDPTVEPRATAEVGVGVGEAPQESVTGTLTLEFIPQEGLPDDPAIQFSTGGRSAGFTIRPGSTTGQFADDSGSISVQTGTVAGEIRVTAAFTANGEDVGPDGTVELVGIIAPGPPVITNVAITDSSANAFTVQVTGFSTPRSIDAADFAFTGRNGVQVQPGQIGLEGAGALFGDWFGMEDSFPFGSAFTLTVPFTISGEPNAVGSVSVTLTNSQGNSAAVSANVP